MYSPEDISVLLRNVNFRGTHSDKIFHFSLANRRTDSVRRFFNANFKFESYRLRHFRNSATLISAS